MKRDHISIQASPQVAVPIVKKFQKTVWSLGNITLLHFRDKQIVQYTGVETYVEDWCKYRLEYQEQKRCELLKALLRDYARLWFLHAFTREGYIFTEPCSAFLRDKEKMKNILSQFPSDAEIEALNFTELRDMVDWLGGWPREGIEGSRQYITQKTIGFFTRELKPLEESEAEYRSVADVSARDAWLR